MVENNGSAPTAEELAAKAKAEAEAKANQDPLKDDLEEIKRKKLAKLEYTKNRVEKQIAELGGKVNDSPKEDVNDDEEVPEWFKNLKAKEVSETEIQKAEKIENESERELVKHYIAEKKLTVEEARAIVNVRKNAKIAEMAGGKPPVRKSVSSGGGSGGSGEQEPEFTAQELQYMRPPFNLSKEKILVARKKTAKEAGVITNGQSDRE